MSDASASSSTSALWNAELVVDAAQAGRLIQRHCPSLPVDQCEWFGEGWDNTAYLINGKWVFRFPRRTDALPGIGREMAILPRVAPHLSIPIPCPAHTGVIDGQDAWPFWGYEIIQGTEMCMCQLTDFARAELAQPLAQFLRELHSKQMADRVLDLDTSDPFDRAGLDKRRRQAREKLSLLSDVLSTDVRNATLKILDDADGLEVTVEPRLVHGDLHLRHILLSEEHQIAGIIDWGDVCMADPAVDLNLYWSALTPEARPIFLEHYGHVSEARLAHARVLALFLNLTLLHYAQQTGRSAVAQGMLTGLKMALQD